MVDSIDNLEKRRGRGSPATDATPVMVPMPPPSLAALDGYIAKQPEPKPTRPEMIRKILEDRLIHEGFIEPAPGLGTST